MALLAKRARGTELIKKDMNIIKKVWLACRSWSDGRFRRRVDRAYFHHEGRGNRFIEGNLFAVKDEKTGSGGTLACNPGVTLEDAAKALRDGDAR